MNYILLDAARMGEYIETAKEKNPQFSSLYKGESEESLAGVAPYMFSFKEDSDFGSWYIENGWGDSWGILIRTAYPMPELNKHFRKFLIVGTEDNQQLYFRFYDPRVLRIFLPTCDALQLREFFEPIEYFIMEDEDPDWGIRCWVEDGHLRSQKIAIEDLKSGVISDRSMNDAFGNNVGIPNASIPRRPQIPDLDVPHISRPSIPSAPSVPSTPSVPSPPHINPAAALPDLPGLPSTPNPSTLINTPSVPATPSVPNIPHTPSVPNLDMPSTPRRRGLMDLLDDVPKYEAKTIASDPSPEPDNPEKEKKENTVPKEEKVPMAKESEQKADPFQKPKKPKWDMLG